MTTGKPRWVVFQGDCRQVLTDYREWFAADAGIDAVVTDPPAGIGFMGKEWDRDRGGREQWVAWLRGAMEQCLRALKPGGHALVWALPRTSHWTATAIEDAGFEIRDVLHYLFATGFPKSLNLPDGKGTSLKPAAEHWILARKPLVGTVAANVLEHGTGALNIDACRIATSDALNGGAYAENPTERHDGAENWRYRRGGGGAFEQPRGRWPAHLALSHAEWCEEVGTIRIKGDKRSGQEPGTRPGGFVGTGAPIGDEKPNGAVYADADAPAYRCVPGCPVLALEGQAPNASRFFYVAKPSRKERDAGCEHLPARSGGEATDREDGSAGLNSPRAGAGRGGGVRNHHPTLKGIDLMRWLVRLITPPGGVVLDPFAGSGTTGCAAVLEGRNFVGIELDPEFAEIARSRISHWWKIAHSTDGEKK